jgi:hypothetical protein
MNRFTKFVARMIPGVLVPITLVVAMNARAELPSIRLDRLTPLGAAAGSTVDLEIAGGDLEEVRTLWFDHPGLSATPIEGKDRLFRLTVAADVPAGTYDVRLVGRWGVSNPRLLAVSHGLQDVVETEPNNDAERAQRIDIHSAINAMSDGNGEDVFRFMAKAGQRMVLDCQAGKLESMLDANMSLTASDGRLLASSSDYHGRDPWIDFLVPADGEYLVRVYDLSYRGGFPYRLLVTDRPHVETVFPRAVQAGQPTELTALGRNLGPQATPSVWTVSDLPLAERWFVFTPPTDLLPLGSYRFEEHPTDHSVLPTAATCTLIGCQTRLLDPPALNAQTLLVTESAVTLEAEPNDQREQPQAVTLPLVLSGRFDRPRDADWFEFEAAENGQHAFEVYCERINGGADPYLVVFDDQGNRVSELDDFGHRINAFDGHLRDPVGMVNLTEKRKYRVLVQDRYRRGGVRYQYVLSIRRPQPDFFPAVIHSQNPGPGGTTIWRGGAVYLDVVIHQQEGFNGEITLTAEELPPGLHAAPAVINNNSRGLLVLWADDNATDFTGPIRLIATGKQGETTLRREVRSYTRVWNDAGMNSSRPTRDLVVAIRDGAPYRLEFADERVEVEAGKMAELKLRLLRRWPDFKNEVGIQPLAFPGNFQLPSDRFTGDRLELTLPLTVQNGTRPGQYTLSVLGQAQVPFAKDPQAKDRPNTLVSLPSRPLTVVVTAAAK